MTLESDRDVSVDWATVAGTAGAGGDFVSSGATATISAGATSTTVAVPIVGDTVDEQQETFTVALSSPSEATLDVSGGDVATVTVDDDDATVLSIADATFTETNANFNGVLTISMTLASDRAVSVDWTASDGTAVDGSDYTLVSGTATIPVSSTSTTFEIEILGDVVDELQETFTVTLTNPSEATLDVSGGDSATVTVLDNDVATIDLSDTITKEGNLTAPLVAAVLSTPADRTITVSYSTSSGTATAGGVDYSDVSGTLTWLAGETEAFAIVSVVDDVIDEFAETFGTSISGPTGGGVLGTSSATATIVDNDVPIVDAPSGQTVVESDSPTTTDVVLTVSLSIVSDKVLSVDYAVAPSGSTAATAGTDYTTAAASGTLTFAAGVTTQDVTVTIVGDELDELAETLALTLSSSVGCVIGTATTTVTIQDDDAAEVSIGDVTVTEDTDASAVLTVTLSLVSDRTVTVDFGTAPSSALAGSDFTTSSGTVTIAAGLTSATLSVPILGDAIDEQQETFSVTLSSPSDSTIASGGGTGTVTVVDDDDTVLSIADATFAETNANFNGVLTISMTLESDRDVSVDWVAVAGTAGAGSDFVASSATATIGAGATSTTVAVPIVGDLVDELQEAFTVQLSSPSEATLDGSGGDVATVTVNDDDATVLSIADVTFTETNVNFNGVFTISMTLESDRDVSVDWATVADTALAGSDFIASGATATIGAGATSTTIAVPIVGDTVDEQQEAFTVELSNPVEATLDVSGGDTATATVNDDDIAEISIGDAVVSEADVNTSAVLTISISIASSRDVSVDWATSAGSATAGSDFVAASGTATISAGGTTTTIAIAIVGDTIDELQEAFTVVLTNPVNAVLDGSGGDEATVTINDDDDFNLVLAAETVSEATVTDSGFVLTMDISADTFSSAVGTDSPATDAIIAAVAGSLGGSYAFQALLQPQISFSDVTRVSSTQITINFAANNTCSYAVDADDVISFGTIAGVAFTSGIDRTAPLVPTSMTTIIDVAPLAYLRGDGVDCSTSSAIADAFVQTTEFQIAIKYSTWLASAWQTPTASDADVESNFDSVGVYDTSETAELQALMLSADRFDFFTPSNVVFSDAIITINYPSFVPSFTSKLTAAVNAVLDPSVSSAGVSISLDHFCRVLFP